MPSLNEPQAEFLALEHKYRAFVAGFGSGKTVAGAAGICQHVWEYPRINSGYFAPTYPLIHDIFYPTIEEVAFDWGLKTKLNESHKEVHFFSGSKYRSTVICRSMENPGDIAGFKIGHAQVDELDLLKQEKAALAWRKIIARMRYAVAGLRNGIDVTTTPEGFKFVYQQFVEEVGKRPELAKLYGMIQASTYDNEANLPVDYIDSLRLSYPPQLIEAYLRGRFVNLASGAVYPDFDRRLNHTDAQISEGETLHIGMDFNVLKMAAIVFVVREGRPLALAEHTKVRDTPAMAELLKRVYRTEKGDKPHPILIYPDASGQNTSSKNASESDLTILKAAGFEIRVNPSNPAVKDRINAVNAQILNDKGERRLMVNTRRCPDFTSALEKQIYDPKNGEPDKKSGNDHPNDAGGYFIVKQWPIVRRSVAVTPLRM